MPAYFVVRCTYGDMDHYHRYEKLAGLAITEFNGRFLITGKGETVQKESGKHKKTVVVEFDSIETALTCYHSQTYQQALKEIALSAERDFVIVEGL